MNCFLIDFENVKSSGLKGIEHLIENDDVYIFYSEYANTITFDVHHKINKSNANLKFFKSGIVGKNALDFQLISYLGYLIAQKKYKNYFVITGDRGFESAVSFWKDFFKQNQFTDLAINRFYNIQDALDKKSIPSKYYNNKKLPPTIPTVETEIELRQLKANNVIVDRNSTEMEKHIGKDLSINDIDTKSIKSSFEDSTTSVEVKTSSQERIDRVKNNNKHNEKSQQSQQLSLEEKLTIVDSPESRQSQIVKNSNNKKNINNNNSNKSQNVNLDKEKSNNIKQSKDNKSKNKNSAQVNINNSKKAFNNQQQKKKNSNKNNNNKVQNNTSKTIKNPVDINSNDTKKVKNTPNEVLNNNIISNVNTSTNEISSIPKSKGFVFGKVNINDDTSIIENIQKKQPIALLEQISNNNIDKSTTRKEPIIKATDLVENIAPKNIDVQEKVSIAVETISDSKPIEINTTTDTSNDKLDSTKKDINANTNATQNENLTSVKPNETKRKVGRPRVKPLKDLKEKPKNNKKFQEDIPNEKLEKMLDKLSQLSELNEYSTDDKIKTCKIVAFSKSKQEGYQAFMSCFGKHKGVEIYKIVKQEFDALKNLYLNN